jgi:aspartate 1-decarboxylase
MHRAKLHRFTITDTKLHYVGSVTIDEDILDLAGILPNEQVHIMNCNNGERLITYAIPGPRGSGCCCLNGPSARKATPGDIVVIIAYGTMPLTEARTFEPTVVLAGENNRPLLLTHAQEAGIWRDDYGRTAHECAAVHVVPAASAAYATVYSDPTDGIEGF